MTSEDVRQRAAEFRQMHLGQDVLVLPNAWDQLSAALFVAAGFPAIATTSAGVAFTQGLPDGEHLGRDRMIEIAAGIARRFAVPVTADLEAGYGAEPAAVATTIEAAIAAGLVGANIEDTDPRSGRLFDFELAVARIRAGRAAADRLSIPFVLNARTDPYLRGGAESNFAESVRRANAYLYAGAICAFVPGPPDSETIARLAAAIHGPLNVLAARAGRPSLSLDEFRQLGVRRVSIGGSLALAAATYVRDVAKRIREQGDFNYALHAMTNAEMNSFLRR